MTAFRLRHAWLPGGLTGPLEIEVDPKGIIAAIRTGGHFPDATPLPGLVVPGFANTHSHAFHRALRGRTHDAAGTFWTWRERMYALANALDPELVYLLARAVYAEMLAAGYTAVGEFHYLHHKPDGRSYEDDPYAMTAALHKAATDVGIRLTLLDTCYLSAGINADRTPIPLADEQKRFTDGSVQAWSWRWKSLQEAFPDDSAFRLGAAIHSVRAVPAAAIETIMSTVDGDTPLHVHLSEQPAENEETLAAYGKTPTTLLSDHKVLGPRTTAVHATHLTDTDIEILGESRTNIAFCPTTEADLADGIGPAGRLHDAGARLVIGSDQHAQIDPVAELRALEYGERLLSGTRATGDKTGHSAGRRVRFSPAELVRFGAANGYRALGLPGGQLVVGAPFDVVCLQADSARTAGSSPDQLLMAASASDVLLTVVGGRILVRQGRHHRLGRASELLTDAIDRAWSAVKPTEG
ncbi:formimidoylglutamate deiminase [Fodinicola acaciae]|uniref:formimidoylglutamate deiminase n=1 Tax=Fodinicola acaciae TaxID=2681555 RepID=UPI0013D355DB|nr:formimidoylglutamate deiminase [Fodinicola acaciae]